MDRESLRDELKGLIIRVLKLEDMKPEDIDDVSPLFGEGLGLDSIDALELVVALEKTYGIKIPDEDVGRGAFGSVNMLADYILRSEAK